jgi:carboxypeptidase PM20D1
LGGIALLAAPNPQSNVNVPSVKINVTDADAAQQHLSEFLGYKTVCTLDAPQHVSPESHETFAQAHEHLRRTYPGIWAQLKVTTVSNYSLLILWKGSDPALKPGALLSHIDVVPADEDPATSKWTHPPFGGDMEAGYIYGRGALDMKNNVVAILEAVNQLLQEGFRPQRSLYVAFGHDEEVGGVHGAAKIVEHLKSQSVQLEFVLDEGGFVIEDGMPPLALKPIAIVGTAEKDYSIMQVKATTLGGHSSMPPVDGSSVAAILARIMTAIDRAPPPIHLQHPMTDFLRALADAAPVCSLAWLLRHADIRVIGALVGRLLAFQPDTAALVRTTAAMTVLSAGTARNVLPQTGNLTINFRHLPGQSAEQMMEYVRHKIPAKDRGRVSVDCLDEQPKSHVSPSTGPHFRLLSRVIQETLAGPKGIVVAPYLVVGGTDAKHYASLSDNIFRFMPVGVSRSAKDLTRIHGTDERIHGDAYLGQIRFFMHFIRSSCGGSIS